MVSYKTRSTPLCSENIRTVFVLTSYATQTVLIFPTDWYVARKDAFRLNSSISRLGVTFVFQ